MVQHQPHDTSGRHGHHHAPHGEFDDPGLAEILDLDAEVLHDYLDAVLDWVAGATGGAVQRVVDLGAGTGTGTVALARRFPGADVVAVDASPSMLARLRETAAAAGVGERVRTEQADLDAGWPDDVGELDLVWAALSLHHVGDAERLLGLIRGALRPGGLLVVTEMAGPVRVLPDDLGLGRPGLEARCHAASDAQPASFDRYPDWDAALARAGFRAVERRSFSLTPPSPEPATGRYARALLARLRSGLADNLDTDDQATLDLLLDDAGAHSLLRRTDLTVRGHRTGWLARRT